MRKLLKILAKDKIWKQVTGKKKQVTDERKHLSGEKKHWCGKTTDVSKLKTKVWAISENKVATEKSFTQWHVDTDLILGCAGRVVVCVGMRTQKVHYGII